MPKPSTVSKPKQPHTVYNRAGSLLTNDSSAKPYAISMIRAFVETKTGETSLVRNPAGSTYIRLENWETQKGMYPSEAKHRSLLYCQLLLKQSPKTFSTGLLI